MPMAGKKRGPFRTSPHILAPQNLSSKRRFQGIRFPQVGEVHVRPREHVLQGRGSRAPLRIENLRSVKPSKKTEPTFRGNLPRFTKASAWHFCMRDQALKGSKGTWTTTLYSSRSACEPCVSVLVKCRRYSVAWA